MRSGCGIVRPINLAGLRVTVSLNFVAAVRAALAQETMRQDAAPLESVTGQINHLEETKQEPKPLF